MVNLEEGKEYFATIVVTYLGVTSGNCGLCGGSGGCHKVKLHGGGAPESLVCERCVGHLDYKLVLEQEPGDPGAI